MQQAIESKPKPKRHHAYTLKGGRFRKERGVILRKILYPKVKRSIRKDHKGVDYAGCKDRSKASSSHGQERIGFRLEKIEESEENRRR